MAKMRSLMVVVVLLAAGCAGDEVIPSETSVSVGTTTSVAAATTTTEATELSSGWLDLGGPFGPTLAVARGASWDGGHAVIAGVPGTLPGGAVYVSEDARQWASLAPTIDGRPAAVGDGGHIWMVDGAEIDVVDLVGYGNHLVITGTSIPESAGSASDLILDALVLVSSDGRSWTRPPSDEVDSRGCWAGPAAASPAGLFATATCLVEDPDTGRAALDAEGFELQTVRVWTSADGTAWELAFETPPGSCRARRMITAGGAALIGASCGQDIAMWSSVDGSTWEEAEAPAAFRLSAAVEGPSGFIGVGSHDGVPVVMTSADMIGWEAVNELDVPEGALEPWNPPLEGEGDVTAQRLLQIGAKWFVLGNAFVRDESTESGVDIPVVWSSVDGETWQLESLDPDLFRAWRFGPESFEEGDQIAAVFASTDGYVFVGSGTWWLWES